MGVYLKKEHGEYYPRWYGAWQVNGKRTCVVLNKWKGTPPGPGETEGDAAFERSKGEAERRLKEAKEKREGTPGAERAEEAVMLQRVYKAVYGKKAKRIRLAELYDRWAELPHRAQSAGRFARVRSVVKKFVDFMGARFPGVREAAELDKTHFKAFFDALDKRGLTARSFNDYASVLREVLSQLHAEGSGYVDYLAILPHRDQNTVSRDPLSDAELSAILDAAREVDPPLVPLLLAGVATGMRKGDLALLAWESVDLEDGFISCKTSKTHKPVDIPLDDPFLSLLEETHKAQGGPDAGFVWPEIAREYRAQPKALNRRLNRVLRAAGFATPQYQRKDGKHLPIPAKKGKRSTVAEVKEGESRKYRASRIGWHSLRAHFVTDAMRRGVDVKIIMAATGHTSLRTLLTHYDQRNMRDRREQMKREFLGNGHRRTAGALKGAARAALPPAADSGEAEVVTPLPAGFADLLSAATPEQLAAVAALLGGCRK